MVSIRDLGMPGVRASTQGMLDQLSSQNRLKRTQGAHAGSVSAENLSAQAVVDTIQLGGVESVGQANRAMAERVMEEIRKIVEDVPNRLPRPVAQPDEFTPEKTADYIVGNVVSFYPLYADVHAEDIPDDQERLDTFMSLVGGAIKTGFDEARSILESLDVLNEEISQGIDLTYTLVEAGLNKFRDLQMSLIEQRAAEAPVDGAEETVAQDQQDAAAEADLAQDTPDAI